MWSALKYHYFLAILASVYCKNSLPRLTHNLFGLRLDLCKPYYLLFMIKIFSIVLPFLPVKGLFHAYLVKTSITHNQYLTFLFFEDNDAISAKSTAKILFSNVAYIFLYLNFLIIGLCNYLASFSFTLTPDLLAGIAPDPVCYFLNL